MPEIKLPEFTAATLPPAQQWQGRVIWRRDISTQMFSDGTSWIALPKQDPVTGSLLSPDGRIVAAGRRGVRAPLPGVGGIGFSLADVVAQAGAPTLSMVVGANGMPALRVQGAVNAVIEISFPGMTNTMTGGDAYLLLDGSMTRGNLATASSYVSQDAAGYAKGWVCNISYGYPAPLNNPYEQGGPVTYWFRRAANQNFGVPTYPAFVADHKLRLTPTAGGAIDVLIYAYGFADRRPKGRIAVVYDDGYDSMMKLGYDSFASRGIPLTLSLIGSVVGQASNVNLNQLRAFINAGNALVAHGPWPNGGQGNLFTAYPNSPNPLGTAIADMIQNRDYLAANGLLVEGADRCYVWPQGVWQQVANNTALLDLALAAGFTLGRSATPSDFLNLDAASKYNRLCAPIIGHTWGGTTANEAANIAAIQTAIGNVASNRADAFLMLHRVLPTTTNDAGMGAGGNITIRHGDLDTLAAAIKTQVDNGLLEAVTMAQMASAPSSLWSTT